MAVFTSPSASASARAAVSSSVPAATATIRQARPRSFSLVGRRSTIRLPYVRPKRTITAVEIIFSTIF